MAPNHGGDPLGSILGQWGPIGDKKWLKTKKITMLQNKNFWLLRGNRFVQKIEFTVTAPNHGGEPLRSILGPMGSHWGQKTGQNRKKLPCPKIRIFYYSAVINLGKKSYLRLWCHITVGPPRSILGPMGSHWGQKMGQNRKKLPCPKIRILTTPRSSIWAKNRIYGYGAKSQ